MTAKNVAAKNWTILSSFDGGYWSNWPLGDKPSGFQTAPTLLGLDLVAGSLTGGENNKGAFITAFMYNPGRQANLGQSSGCKIMFRDPGGDNTWHEVDNYRFLLLNKTYTKSQALEVGFQIGTFGGNIPTGQRSSAAVVLDVKAVVNGVDSNVLTAYFTVQPGRFWFVDAGVGSDATGVVDDPTHPFRYIQFSTDGNTTYTGIWNVNAYGSTPGLRGGDTIVWMGNTVWRDNAGSDGRLVRFRNTQHAGSAPDGTVGKGYINFVRYPGAVGANAPHAAAWADPSSGGRGGIQGVDSGHVDTTGAYVVISGLTLASAGNGVISDGAPVNLQQGSDFWRVINCDLSWPLSTIVGLAGGVAGQGDNVEVAWNVIHDIGSNSASQTNHGIYAGTSNEFGDPLCHNWKVHHNWIKDVTGGSGIQFYDSEGSTDHFTGMKVWSNWVERIAKNGMTMAGNVQSADIWDNVLADCVISSFKISDDVSGRLINFVHNTIVQTHTLGSYPYPLVNDGGFITSGTVNIKFNIVCLSATHDSGMDFTNFGSGDTAVSLDYNQYFDFKGSVSAKPSKDTHGAYGDPLFTNQAASDYTLQSGSPCAGAVTVAEPIAVATDFYGIARPVTGTGSPGGTKNDVGATQGVGT